MMCPLSANTTNYSTLKNLRGLLLGAQPQKVFRHIICYFQYTKNCFYSHEVRTHTDITNVVKTVQSFIIIITMNTLVSLSDNVTYFTKAKNRKR